MREREYWLGFSAFPGIGPKRFSQLLAYFGSAKHAWLASETDLRKAGLGEKTTNQLLDFRVTFSFADYLSDMQQKQVDFVILTDPLYPLLLQQLANPPFMLYTRGNQKLLEDKQTIGIVGTRKITSYGEQVTSMLTADLVAAGFTIVSGLAMGVDACSHQTTLDQQGKTIAVLGCGVDCCSPRENTSLYNRIIAKGGLVVSEFPVSMVPSIGSFPSRNRIIAGLSQAVIVTEGAEDSGALITAKDSFALRRPVFAVPGQITSSLSKGPLQLLQKGAELVTSAEDILQKLQMSNDQFPIKETKKQKIKGETIDEQLIIDVLENEELSFDEIVRQTKIDPAQMGMMLSMMELRGVVKIGEGKYRLISFPA